MHLLLLLLLLPGEAARKAKLKLARMAKLAAAVDGPSAGSSGRGGGGGGGGGNGHLLDERLLLNPDDDGYDEDDEDDDEDDDPSLGGTGMNILGRSTSVERCMWVCGTGPTARGHHLFSATAPHDLCPRATQG